MELSGCLVGRLGSVGERLEVAVGWEGIGGFGGWPMWRGIAQPVSTYNVFALGAIAHKFWLAMQPSHVIPCCLVA